MTIATPELLREIAAHIRSDAETLRECHATPPEFDLGTMEPEVREVYERELRYAAVIAHMAEQEPVGAVRTCVWTGSGWTVSLNAPSKMRVGDPLFAARVVRLDDAREAVRKFVGAWRGHLIHEMTRDELQTALVELGEMYNKTLRDAMKGRQ